MWTKILGWIWVLCFLWAASLPTSLHAQERRFKGGVVAGINLAQVDGDDLAGYNQIGMNAGGRVAAILSDRWQLSLELLFSQQGSSRSTTDPVAAAFEKIRLNLVEAPVLIQFREWKFLVSAGGAYARLMSFTTEDTFGTDTSDLQRFNEDLFYAVLGLTYQFNDHFGINLNWSRALTDMQAEGAGGRLINRNLAIRSVYMF